MENENKINFTNAITIIHSIFLERKLGIDGQFFIDGTCGKGEDTKFLSQLGEVYSFDIQIEAINEAKKHNLNNVKFIKDCHTNIKKYVHVDIDGAIFNLGYLPGGNKKITTQKDTSIKAIQEVLDIMKINGLLGIVIYPGHPAGKEEEIAILNQIKLLDQNKYNVLVINYINRINNSPYPILIERIRS